jgi:hypothetical protein
MAKLYTVKEIAELMTREFGANPAGYEFTEERVRARLRSARARGIIKAQHLGYDRRTNYYTAEDVERLKSSWVGPESAEFPEYPEDLQLVNPDEEEITVRKATVKDIEAILTLLPSSQPVEDKEALKPYIERMLKSSQYASFVAVLNEERVVGSAQVEISPPMSLIRGLPTGAIYIYSEHAKQYTPIVVRSLYQRANLWLTTFNVLSRTVELPTSLSDLISELVATIFTDPKTQVIMAESDTSSQ